MKNRIAQYVIVILSIVLCSLSISANAKDSDKYGDKNVVLHDEFKKGWDKYSNEWNPLYFLLDQDGGRYYYWVCPDTQCGGDGLNSPLKKALMAGFHPLANHNVLKTASPSFETMTTI